MEELKKQEEQGEAGAQQFAIPTLFLLSSA